ncbi:MAG TPA: hypothetical protein EYP90_03240 [Chromatiaceae bacterium]|nr:hypothetical protein [Chromatiaceae bacterium]
MRRHGTGLASSRRHLSVGGVTTHVIRWLQQPLFENAFTDKGRMSHLTKGFSIQVVMEPRAGLLGAIRQALQTQETP